MDVPGRDRCADPPAGEFEPPRASDTAEGLRHRRLILGTAAGVGAEARNVGG